MKIADDIIAAVCRHHGIPREQLLAKGVQTRGVTLARKDAIGRLRAQHFSSAWIARFLNLSRAAVQRHIYPKVARCQQLGGQRWRKRQKELKAAAEARA